MTGQPMAVALVAVAMGVAIPGPDRRKVSGDRLILRSSDGRNHEVFAVFDRATGTIDWQQVTDTFSADQLGRWTWFCREPTPPDHPFGEWIAAVACAIAARLGGDR